MLFIYVLKLASDKWYVGKTDNVGRRFEEHKNGSGSSWTKKHKPIEIAATIINSSSFDEDRTTKEYMLKYGIDNVRGASYVQIELSIEQRLSLLKEIWSAQDCCTNCGESSHFVRVCPNKSIEDRSTTIVDTFTSSMELHRSQHKLCITRTPTDKHETFVAICHTCKEMINANLEENDITVRQSVMEFTDDKQKATIVFIVEPQVKTCEWNNHDDKSQCYAKTTTCFRCGRQGHYASQCYAKTTAIQNTLIETCFRCGRHGHYASKCYAKTALPTHSYFSYDSDRDSDGDD